MSDSRHEASKADLTRLLPYGDTMNDGKVQVSFSLPVEAGEKAKAAALQVAAGMGLTETQVTHQQVLDPNFTFFVVYGKMNRPVDYTAIRVQSVGTETRSMDENDRLIEAKIGRKLKVIGASCGTDAHTVGIDAIMNMKGYAGHYGMERYRMLEAVNMGSQISAEQLVRTAIQEQADIVLVSQTVTQKDAHLGILTEVVDLFEAEGVRDRVILICGGARISHELARELGYDAGFGPGFFADDVVTFAVDCWLSMKNRT
ncbi:MAG TPA: hypothetical protein GXZ64_08155 [Clostridiaceae bacterium]|nr:hypothetical protein [Clostridiaceae bacterium]